MATATEALQRLIDGNQRFLAGTASGVLPEEAKREALKDGQAPFAVILGCADSRVSPELIFDQGLGELFVVRTAGHVATPIELGSIEYAVEHLGARLIVVLGHSSCGAVQATLGAIDDPESSSTPNIEALIEQIRPAVSSLGEAEGDQRLADAVEANVHATVEHLSAGSDLLREREDLVITGAVYSLETGAVELVSPSPGS